VDNENDIQVDGRLLVMVTYRHRQGDPTLLR
jgi:hypothetical protein